MKVLLLLIMLATLVMPVNAASISTKTTMNYYKINGDSAGQLRNQMKQKGPRGYWAYAKWFVRWTKTCEITLEINYTFPKWSNKNSAPKNLRNKWNRMFTVLKRHEENHGKHGINAAKELLSNNCRQGNSIIKKWANEDKKYDKRTSHGIREGISLR